jgi:hypothetical protein
MRPVETIKQLPPDCSDADLFIMKWGCHQKSENPERPLRAIKKLMYGWQWVNNLEKTLKKIPLVRRMSLKGLTF